VYWRSSARPPAFAVAETRTGHCQELITWAGKLALGRLKPTLTMPDEVWRFHRNESGGTSRWLEI
jgi:hypothetical protein